MTAALDGEGTRGRADVTQEQRETDDSLATVLGSLKKAVNAAVLKTETG